MSGRLPCGEVDTVSRERALRCSTSNGDRMKEGPVHAQSPSGASKNPEPPGRRNFLNRASFPWVSRCTSTSSIGTRKTSRRKNRRKYEPIGCGPPVPLKKPNSLRVVRAAENVSMRARTRVFASSKTSLSPTFFLGERPPSSILMNNHVTSVRIFLALPLVNQRRFGRSAPSKKSIWALPLFLKGFVRPGRAVTLV